MLRSLPAAALSLALLLPAGAQAHADPGAAESFRQARAQVVALLEADASDAKVRARVDQLIDYRFMAVDALGGPEHYAKRCKERCAEFEALLTRMIRHQYLRRLHAKDRGHLELVGEETRPESTTVKTRVEFVDPEGKQRRVRIAYVMHRVDGAWRVREIMTDGVSLTANTRHELKRLYRKGGIDAIIERLQEKLATLEAG